MPVTMTDRQSGRNWQVSLKRREVRELSVLEGLDRQDRDYAEHREAGMTDQEFRAWQDGAPELPLEDMVAGLLQVSGTSSFDRMATSGFDHVSPTSIDADNNLDAAILPASAGTPATDGLTSKEGSGGGGSLLDIVGGGHRGQGVYVSTFFVLAGSDLVDGRQSLIDIDDGRGRSTLGLVAALDRGLGLALVQVPRPGMPVMLKDDRRHRSSQVFCWGPAVGRGPHGADRV